MTQTTPLPNGPDAQYQHHLAAGRFMIQRCNDCARHVFAPRVLCKHCGSDQLDWVQTSGQGTVYAATVVRQKPEKGGDYLYAMIELAEGVRMISTVIDTPPQDVRIGDAVVALIDDAPRVVFRKEGTA
ncbi:Zn-ribbon domain-containing OB-fold protein [Pararhodobacter zhoushanensis]|uniref:Zn-ribbon domain-containing OB-fold protein n=1 Tax=Pararhodobacter zhoushanensis TaxID=2479545 RepID=A0ABT3H5B0_9RHOB|nr:Zn-ribbon domain-containing OB-fold protein [Pararhodobacter zhoushanensis]MCW1934987.1 Zn-ribbon domain-containing OB-fold protein [Pararhodobacter zhoushanensis]